MRNLHLVLLFSICLFGNETKTFAVDQPNIVLILADDLGYGDVACYNDRSKVPTPNLDQLAREGMLFSDAHSPSTVCTPTRYSVLTGRMAFRNGMRGVFTGAGGPCLIEAGRLTVGDMLRKQGYTTAMFGKWHVGLTFYDSDGKPINQNGLKQVQRIDYSRPISGAPIHRGFDKFFGTACCPTTDWLYAWIDGDRVPNPPTAVIDRSTLPKHPYSFDCRGGMIADDFEMEEVDMVFLKKSIQFLEEHARENADQPFFLFHSAQAVHLPSFPGKQFQGKTDAGPHGDFIFEFDFVVGELMKTLKRLNFDKNTLVIVTSDNGPEVGTARHMRADHQHDGARPWRGLKRDQWEGGHRVPFIAKWPGHVPAGSKCNSTICLTDLMATYAAVTQAQLPNDAAEDSFNLLPTLLDPNVGPPREFTIHQTISLDLAIRRGKWKYLDHLGSGGNQRKKKHRTDLDGATGQLYNLAEDPRETKNLFFENSEIVQSLKSKLDEFVASGRSVPVRN